MRNKAFSLAELLTALIIVSILVIAMTTIYQASMSAVLAIDEKLDEGFGSTDVLHRMLDDISTVSSLDTETSLTLESKVVDGVAVYRLEVVSNIYDNAGKEVLYKKVIWQSDYDYMTGTISLYRCMGGLDIEDPILNTQARNNPDSDIFVPVVSGLTYFTIQVPQETNTSQEQYEDYLDVWDKEDMPGAILVELSFAEPVEYVTGEVEVPVEDRITRRISVNRSKDYKFRFIPKDLEGIYGEDEEQLEDEELGEEDMSEDGEIIEEISEDDDGGTDD
jgi:hypothetical protein